MSDAGEFAGLEQFLADRGSALLGTAVLLAGSREAGEDLLQLALERLLRRWRRIDGDPEGYLRRTLYHLAVDRWRWRGRHPEVGLAGELPYRGAGTAYRGTDAAYRGADTACRGADAAYRSTGTAYRGTDAAADVDLRDALGRALAALPARQRAVLVLRYFEQLTEAEIAEALGCSAGAVKSSASRGLQRLRAIAASWDLDERDELTKDGATA